MFQDSSELFQTTFRDCGDSWEFDPPSPKFQVFHDWDFEILERFCGNPKSYLKMNDSRFGLFY